MLVFKVLYWLGLVAEIVIRAPYQKNIKAPKTEQHISRFEKIVPGLLTIGTLLFPLIYSVTHWLDFANYNLPSWLGWLGALVLVCALLVFARAHTDLKSNWSPTLEIFENHSLVTNGIYGYIRHPMYASQWLWVIAQTLLLQNWLAGPLDLVLWLFLYTLRVKAEEKMMLDKYGEQYQAYMQKTGAVIPKF